MDQEPEFDEESIKAWKAFKFSRLYSIASMAAGEADNTFREIIMAAHIAGDTYRGIADTFLDYAAKCRAAAKAAVSARRTVLADPYTDDTTRALCIKDYCANAIGYIAAAEAAERVATKATGSGVGITSRDIQAIDDIHFNAAEEAMRAMRNEE